MLVRLEMGRLALPREDGSAGGDEIVDEAALLEKLLAHGGIAVHRNPDLVVVPRDAWCDAAVEQRVGTVGEVMCDRNAGVDRRVA
ncbi:MAG: hypothetical protein ABI990_02330 [Actinomycetota bacterium]